MPRRRHGSRTLRRDRAVRSERPCILIVCEGRKTEPCYFKGLKNYLRLSSVSIEIKHGNSAPISVVDYAIKLREQRKQSATRVPYDSIWCVMDVEIPRHESLDRACQKARDNHLNLALSNPCFEYWYLLHFERTSRCMQSVHEVTQLLRQYTPNYSKSDPEYFAQVNPHTETAIANAEAIISERHYEDDLRDCNPSTHVHLLVKELRQHAPSR